MKEVLDKIRLVLWDHLETQKLVEVMNEIRDELRKIENVGNQEELKQQNFIQTMDIYSPDELFTRIFLEHLRQLGYVVEDWEDSIYKYTHIWLNESEEGETFGKGKVRLAVGNSDEKDCKNFKLPDEFYKALYEASIKGSTK